jgi:hypothetical protein
MAHRNQSGAGARIVSRSVGTASLLKEAAPVLLDGILPLIGQHYIGRRDPAHSVTPRQQRYLADRGASTMLDHSAFLIVERSDREPYIRLPHGGPRVRIHLSPAGSQARTVDGSEKARPLTPPRAPAEELMTAPPVPGEAPHRKAPNNRGPFAHRKAFLEATTYCDPIQRPGQRHCSYRLVNAVDDQAGDAVLDNLGHRATRPPNTAGAL